MINVLFVCTKNKWRSATAETLYYRHHIVVARSRGTSRSARKVITRADIVWANAIFVMENKHKSFINSQYRSLLKKKFIVVLDIPDEYHYMDPELVSWLKESVDANLKYCKPN